MQSLMRYQVCYLFIIITYNFSCAFYNLLSLFKLLVINTMRIIFGVHWPPCDHVLYQQHSLNSLCAYSKYKAPYLFPPSYIFI